MFNKNLLMVCLFFALVAGAIQAIVPGFRLSKISWSGAGVLAYTTYPGKNFKYYILGRERRSGTWSILGGTREAGETHPSVTAAREFKEETYGTFPEITTSYLNDNAKEILIRHNYVTYVVPLALSHFYNFNTRVAEISSGRFRLPVGQYFEIDKLAEVREDRLKDAIANAPARGIGNEPLVQATIRENSIRGSYVAYIPIRWETVGALRGFFAAAPYTLGLDQRAKAY